MVKSNSQKAVSGVYWMGFMSASSVVIKLLITMILSRLLIPSEFGTVAAIQVVISFADILWMMGVGPAIVQKKELSSIDIETGNTLNRLFGLSIYVFILLNASRISLFVGIEDIAMLKILSLVFLIHSFSGVSEALLQREMNFKDISLINIYALIVYGVFAISLALFEFGAWALIFAQIIQVIVKSALTLKKRPIRLTLRINNGSVKELLYFGTGFTLSRVLNNFANQGDYFVVNRELGSFALGYYNRAYQLLAVPTSVIGTVMDKVLFPLISKHQNSFGKIRFVYYNITSLVALVAFPVSLVSLIGGYDIIYLFLGKEWSGTVLPFKILIISLFFRMAYKICDSIVRSLGEVYKRIWVQVVYAVLIIGGAYIGKSWGISGVAVATVVAIIVNYIIMILLVHKLIDAKMSELLTYILPIVIITLIIGIIAYPVNIIISSIDYILLRLGALGLFVLGFYLITFKYLLVKFMPVEFYEFVTTIMQSTFKKFKTEKISFHK